MPAADQAARRIDWNAAIGIDVAVLDCSPVFAGRRDSEMIDGHVLGRREAVVRFDAVQVLDAANAGTSPSVHDRLADMRKYQRIVTAALDLVDESQAAV